MVVCFICDKKIYGERTRVCSSITPHCNIPYPQKIAQLIGDEFVVIVTPSDHMCKTCTSLLTHMDKLENDLKLVKNAILSYIQKKYGILLPDQIDEDDETVNVQINAEEQHEKDDHKVHSGVTEGVFPTVTTAAVVTPVQTPFKLLNTQQRQEQQQKQYQPQQQQQQQSSTQQDSANKIKIYKCGVCTFQSKELGHVRFHMRTHMNKKEPEKPILNQAAANALTPVPQQKKRIYRCQVCSKSFDSRIDCLEHIHKDHTQPTPSTSNGVREMEDSRPVIISIMKPQTSKTQENKAESPMDVDKDQQDNNKGTVDTDMMLNDNVHSKGSANVEQEEGTENEGEGEATENSQGDKTVKEIKLKIKHEAAQEEAAGEDKVQPEQEEADQETLDSVEKEVYEDNANVENKMGDLDVESMLATVYNDYTTNSGDTQNKA